MFVNSNTPYTAFNLFALAPTAKADDLGELGRGIDPAEVEDAGVAEKSAVFLPTHTPLSVAMSVGTSPMTATPAPNDCVLDTAGRWTLFLSRRNLDDRRSADNAGKVYFLEPP